jgi:hypothetical protein
VTYNERHSCTGCLREYSTISKSKSNVNVKKEGTEETRLSKWESVYFPVEIKGAIIFKCNKVSDKQEFQ